jgi:hypothetical protein
LNVVTIAAADSPYTVLGTEDVLLCDPSSGNIEVALPTAVGYSQPIEIKNISTVDSANVVVVADGAETIDTFTDMTLGWIVGGGRNGAKLVSDNANWWIISSHDS